MAEKANHLVEAFIARWQNNAGGAERANYGMFLTELCDVIGVAHPDVASHETEFNDYAFERGVTKRDGGERIGSGRIDLYKRGSFVLEAKQSRWKGGKKSVAGQTDMFSAETEPQARSRADRNWDVLMMNARRQAEDYAKALPASDGWPPFVIVCDVGFCLEIYADFSGQGKNYAQFPDRQRFRVYLEDLRQEEVRNRLKAIWETPLALDPSKEAVKASRKIAGYLAEVTKRLEKAGHNAEEVATFLMRCLFTMFSEDMDLLPEGSFTSLLERCAKAPEKFVPMVTQLWQAMDKGNEFAYGIEAKVRQFNGNLFRNPQVFPLDAEDIGALLTASRANWTEVDPSIFGTLLEQALDSKERSKLGAHYTPRAYVERLVIATIMEPLKADWSAVKNTAERQKLEGDADAAIKTVRDFHEKLYNTRVLDPACGTGNFLYVSLELMKRLEGEVLEALVDLGGQEALRGMDRHEVDPHQFLGLELNARARHIAELVLWIGFLQWHKRNRGELPGDPVLRDYGNIKQGDAVLTWDGYPVPKIVDGKETLPRARRPDWPEAEFIVGNPPFIGGKDVRSKLGDTYTETLWGVHTWMNDSADFVMYWWDRAAEILTRKGTKMRRFGLVTTNSITQVFQRRVVERHLSAKTPVSLVMAIGDHPWTKATKDSAAVRIAMSVAETGTHDGLLFEVTREAGLDTDDPVVELRETKGRINADLTVGVDLASVAELKANAGVCARGMVLHGAGFIVTPSEAKHLGLGRITDLDKHIRPYRNGRDLTNLPRNVMVIDLFGLSEVEVRKKFPEVFQHVIMTVKENKDKDGKVIGRDVNARDYRKKNWWLFGENVPELRKALANLPRYIATVETAKHRIFQFLDAEILPDNKVVVFASDEAFFLGMLMSTWHVEWSLKTGGWIGFGNDPVYVKSRCFDPFPFPECEEAAMARIGALAEEIDAHRKRAQAEHGITLTQMYNVLEKVRKLPSPLWGGIEGGGRERSEPAKNKSASQRDLREAPPPLTPPHKGEGDSVSPLTPAEQDVFDRALILTLKHLHDELDAAVADAYGWPRDLPEAEVLARLVALNKARAAEEARGHVRWLRPDYQIPRFGSQTEKAQMEAELLGGSGSGKTSPADKEVKPNFPAKDIEQTVAVTMALVRATVPLSAAEIARQFKQGRKIENRIEFTLKAMARMGELSSADGGRKFELKRAA